MHTREMLGTKGVMLTLVWSSFDAAKTIACDLIPRIATGFKLHSTQTLRPCSARKIAKNTNKEKENTCSNI